MGNPAIVQSAISESFNEEKHFGPRFHVKLCIASLAILVICTICAVHYEHFSGYFSQLLNVISRKWGLFDHAVDQLNRTSLSGLVLFTTLCYVWFQNKNTEVRAGIVVGVLAAGISGLVSRTLQIFIPTHLRPMQVPELHLLPPAGISYTAGRGWSSFPSDHAAVYFGIVLVIYLANRKLGWIAFAYSCLVCLVRIYQGLHFLVDIIAGGALGMALVSATYPLRRLPSLHRLLEDERMQPAFYAAAFYIAVTVAGLFDDVRSVLGGISRHLQ